MTIRRFLLWVPVVGRVLERRWIPNSAERDRHQVLVRGRLPGAAVPSDPQPDPAETEKMPGV